MIRVNKQKLLYQMELATAAYKTIQPYTKDDVMYSVDDLESGVQYYLRKNGDHLNITFRGTDTKFDWKTDLTFWKKCIPYDNYSSKIRVHTGFINAYRHPHVRDVVHLHVTEDIHHITVSGHSFGAALAVLCAVDLEFNFPQKDIEVYLFGCPRVGNRAFKKSYNKRVYKTLRVENGNDVITKVPFAFMGFRHVGAKIHIGNVRQLGVFSAQDHYQHAYYSGLIMKFLGST